MKQDNFIEDWLATETSIAQKKILQRVFKASEQLTVPSNQTNSEAWESFLSKVENEAPIESTIKKTGFISDYTEGHQSNAKFWALLTGIAAMLVAVYVAFFSPLNSPENIIGETGLAENKMMVLPAGSKLTLNSASLASYQPEEWYEQRVVRLEGEAFFEVTKGAEFLVKTSNGEVQVSGTSFNVFSRGRAFFVECSTGSVLVTTKSGQKVLKSGQKVELELDKLLLTNINPDKTAKWREGEFYFDATALQNVINEMERQFDIELTVNSDITDRYYSGFFSRDNLKEALQLVFVPMGLSFEINDGKVTLQ